MFYDRYRQYRPDSYDKTIAALRPFGDEDDTTVRERMIDALRHFRGFCAWNQGLSGLVWDELLKEAEQPLPDESAPPVFTKGRVKFFNHADDKKFGFLDNDVFFHMSNGVHLICDGSDQPASNGALQKMPKLGDFLVYGVVQGKKGPKADWWGFEYDYILALEAIKKRPTIRMRRHGTNITCWEGKDIGRLRHNYPMAWHQSDRRFDVSGYYFEKLENGAWVSCPDPR